MMSRVHGILLKNNYYSAWHSTKYHSHLHWGIFIIACWLLLSQVADLNEINMVNAEASTPHIKSVSINNDSQSGIQPPDRRYKYRNVHYNFSLSFIDNLNVKEFDDGQGASTVVFENINNARGFQIFIVPYSEETISEERFLRDVPSGVRIGIKNFYIDGVLATSFYSKDMFLGDTYEIWIIRDGFLYEINTLKGLEPWLLDILESWRFI